MSVYNHNKRQGGPRWDGVQKFCVPHPPFLGTVWAGKQQILHGKEEGEGRKETWEGDISFIKKNPASLPALPLIPKKKYNKSLTHPRGTSGLKLLRAPSSCPFPPPREAAPARPSPSPPLRPLPRPREGKHKGARSGAGPRGPRTPGLPHYCPLAGSAAAATAGVRAAESRRD